MLLENPVGCRVVEAGREEEFARKLLEKLLYVVFDGNIISQNGLR